MVDRLENSLEVGLFKAIHASEYRVVFIKEGEVVN